MEEQEGKKEGKKQNPCWASPVAQLEEDLRVGDRKKRNTMCVLKYNTQSVSIVLFGTIAVCELND